LKSNGVIKMKRWMLSAFIFCSALAFSAQHEELIDAIKVDDESKLEQLMHEEYQLPKGKQLLDYVVEFKALKCGKLLLVDPDTVVKLYDFDVESKKMIETPFQKAIATKDLDLITLFMLNEKVDPNAVFSMSIGILPLKDLEYLLDHYDVDLSSASFGESQMLLPISVALFSEVYDVFDFLLNRMEKADLSNYPTSGAWKGKTIYHSLLVMPVSFVFPRLKYLLKSGVDPTMLNDEGKTFKECCTDPQLLALLTNADMEYKSEGFGPNVRVIDGQFMHKIKDVK